MSQAIARRNLSSASLRQTGGARTVLLRMAADEARAARIRQLKDDHPGVTWGSIADAIGVKERSAVEWARTGGISYENAKKLSMHFECDLDWLWRGSEPTVANNGSNQLDRIEQLLTQLAADQQSHESAQKALGESLTALAEEVAALRGEGAPRRRRAS